MTTTGPVSLASRLAETGGYGAATLLLVATLVVAGFLGSGPTADGIGLALSVGAFVVVLRSATARGRAWPAIAGATGGLAALVIVADPADLRPVLWLAWLAIVAIGTIGLAAVAADLLGSRRVSPRVIAGTVCLYVLIGYAFAVVYGLVESATGTPVLAQLEKGSFADYLYFSFATITTTGFGDVTIGHQSWRLLAVAEALVGQVYLVVVVASMVGAARLLPGRTDPGPADRESGSPAPGSRDLA
jgi:hypothetical protein